MRRDQLEHIIRAASEITHERDFIVVGSQAILATVPDAPREAPELAMSLEVDLFPKDAPEKADDIEGSLGELSMFHETHGFYADGVGAETAVLPDGWQDRLITVQSENTGGARALCLEVNDLAISKLAAGREKDHDFVEALLKYDLVDMQVLYDRCRVTPLEPERRRLIEAWLDARQPKPPGLAR